METEEAKEAKGAKEAGRRRRRDRDIDEGMIRALEIGSGRVGVRTQKWNGGWRIGIGIHRDRDRDRDRGWVWGFLGGWVNRVEEWKGMHVYSILPHTHVRTSARTHARQEWRRAESGTGVRRCCAAAACLRPGPPLSVGVGTQPLGTGAGRTGGRAAGEEAVKGSEHRTKRNRSLVKNERVEGNCGGKKKR